MKTKNERQKEYRLKTGNSATKKYEKTHSGYLMRKYRNMKSRTCGIQWRKSHLYMGKELLSKEDFYNWAKNHQDFLRLFDDYVKSNYERRLAPTVDRIDSSKGYVLSNMRWLTHSENSRQTSRYKK